MAVGSTVNNVHAMMRHTQLDLPTLQGLPKLETSYRLMQGTQQHVHDTRDQEKEDSDDSHEEDEDPLEQDEDRLEQDTLQHRRDGHRNESAQLDTMSHVVNLLEQDTLQQRHDCHRNESQLDTMSRAVNQDTLKHDSHRNESQLDTPLVNDRCNWFGVLMFSLVLYYFLHTIVPLYIFLILICITFPCIVLIYFLDISVVPSWLEGILFIMVLYLYWNVIKGIFYTFVFFVAIIVIFYIFLLTTYITFSCIIILATSLWNHLNFFFSSSSTKEI